MFARACAITKSIDSVRCAALHAPSENKDSHRRRRRTRRRTRTAIRANKGRIRTAITWENENKKKTV